VLLFLTVFSVTTDIIALSTAVLLDRSVGGVSNREIFLVQATLDSCGIGLMVLDDSYVNIAGVWAASSDFHQIYVGSNTNALLVMNGGTIFNGGAYECPHPETDCNGITMLSGSFILSGVEVRYNLGRGIWLPDVSQVKDFSINGGRIMHNGQGVNISSTITSGWIMSSTLCAGNGALLPNNYPPSGTLTGNLGC
jgi:hypothetical protein